MRWLRDLWCALIGEDAPLHGHMLARADTVGPREAYRPQVGVNSIAGV